MKKEHSMNLIDDKSELNIEPRSIYMVETWSKSDLKFYMVNTFNLYTQYNNNKRYFMRTGVLSPEVDDYKFIANMIKAFTNYSDDVVACLTESCDLPTVFKCLRHYPVDENIIDLTIKESFVANHKSKPTKI